ncbi:MAG: sigma-70 family RNA polymerase sigma factor [bacterium]
MEKKPADAKLVRTYLSGNDRSFENLFKRYERPLFSFILKFVRDRQIAEDIFQQTWIKVLNGLTGYEEKGKFSSWLFGIANNCCIDHSRKETRSKVDDRASAEGMDLLEGDDCDPESTFLKQEETEWLEKAIQTLPIEQKEVVLLRFHGQLPFKEIARVLGSPLNTVLGRMHYAVCNLRKMVDQEYGSDLKHVLS